jgi:Kdo2-lipid IVA lauroyltransferase/acyltransferase
MLKGGDLILSYILKALSLFARILPASVSYTIAEMVGNAAFYFWPRGRRNMVKSIAAVLYQGSDSPEARRDARYGMQNYYKFILDLFRYAQPPKDFFESNIDLIGVENIDNSLAEGKGVILVSLHMGNLDIGIRALAYAGYKVNAIVDKIKPEQVNRFIQTRRANSGLKLIDASESILQFLSILKHNEIIALMIDGRCFERGILVKLGNKHIVVPSSLAAMCLRTEAKILPCGLVRSSNTRFHAIIGKPVQFKTTGQMVEDARELTQCTVRQLEEIARIFPDQWYIFHKLIKDGVTSPELAPRPETISRYSSF